MSGEAFHTDKKALRKEYRARRRELISSGKEVRDTAIWEQLFSLPEYSRADTILLYASMEDEIDTFGAMERMIGEGKTVALPRCVDGTREMRFYPVTAIGSLITSHYGIREPDPKLGEPLSHFGGALCVVPGLAFDQSGYRLGYGGGYYDRFLSGHKPDALVGLCYHDLFLKKLPHGQYDLPIGMVITEQGIFQANGKGLR